jgi:hypothetical protein
MLIGQLPHKARYHSPNIRFTEERFNLWLDARHPSYKVRSIFDKEHNKPDGFIELGSYSIDRMRLAERMLFALGAKRVAYKPNGYLVKTRQKLYNGI